MILAASLFLLVPVSAPLRIFRQKTFMDWARVFDRIVAELRKLVPERIPTRSVAIEASPGELIDKIAILEIRAGNRAQLVLASLHYRAGNMDAASSCFSTLHVFSRKSRRVCRACDDAPPVLRRHRAAIADHVTATRNYPSTRL